MLSKIQRQQIDKQDRAIAERYAILGPGNGTITQIAQEFTVSRQTVYNALKRWGTKGKARSFPTGESKRVKRGKNGT